MTIRVAYLSLGRLFIVENGQKPREIESAFAKQSLERQARQQQVDGWKERSGVWGSMGMQPPEWSQWDESGMEARRKIRIVSVAKGEEPNLLYYLLDLGDVSGVFRYDLARETEYRLMHRNGFPARSLACAADGELAVSILREDGTVGLAFSQDEGRHWTHVSGGDAVDESPQWVAGSRHVVFQSAQIGRNEQGMRLGLAPYQIESLTLDGGEAKVIAQQEESDLLQPKMTSDETLYYVKRPYRASPHSAVSVTEILKDVVLFPYRVLRALFFYLNFFSMMYSGKPLATSMDQNPWRRNDPRAMMLWGHMIDTRTAMTKTGSTNEETLVPNDWQLIRRAADGEETTLAEGVAGFDVCRDGTIVYSNGRIVFAVDAEGNRSELCRETLIESVLAVS